MTFTKTFKGMPDREARKIVEKEGTVIKFFTFGPYTAVKMTFEAEGKTIIGYGLSKRSLVDSNKAVTGRNQAINSAVRAIVCKCKGKYPHHPLQG